jgi:hypothetical protein
MQNHPRTRLLITAAAITVGLAAPPPRAPAPAIGGHFKLKAKHDDGRIEMEYEVDSNRAGQVWAVRITDNGAVVVKRHATTAGRSGSFTIRKRIADRTGPDKIRAHATFKNHTCRGTVKL